MDNLIAIFRMTEIDPKVRARLIIKIGKHINDVFSANFTESVVYELVLLLDPQNPILEDEHYLIFRF